MTPAEEPQNIGHNTLSGTLKRPYDEFLDKEAAARGVTAPPAGRDGRSIEDIAAYSPVLRWQLRLGRFNFRKFFYGSRG